MGETTRVLGVSVLISFLQGCGGSGGASNDAPIGSVDDESAQGLWLGTYRVAGGPERAFNLIAAPSGQLAGLIAPTTATAGDPRLIAGTGTTSGAQLLATGTLFALTGTLPSAEASAPLSAFSGTVDEGVLLTGNLTAGGETGTFSVSYNAKSGRGASLSSVQGVYVTSTGAATMTITSAGAVTFNSTSGCVGNGTIAVIDPALNMYSWSLTITSCTVSAANGAPSGLAMLDDATAGGQSNSLVMIGAQTGAPFFFIGAK